MGPKITVLRILQRGVIACLLVVGLVFTIFMLVQELQDDRVNETLASLLGVGVGALGTSLFKIIEAIATNAADRPPGESE